jgi:hypothetical protein
MSITQVIAVLILTLGTFSASYLLGYREGKEDGLAASIKWRRNLKKSVR